MPSSTICPSTPDQQIADDPSDLIAITELHPHMASRNARFTVGTLRNRIYAGVIRSEKIAGKLHVYRSDLDAIAAMFRPAGSPVQVAA